MTEYWSANAGLPQENALGRSVVVVPPGSTPIADSLGGGPVFGEGVYWEEVVSAFLRMAELAGHEDLAAYEAELRADLATAAGLCAMTPPAQWPSAVLKEADTQRLPAPLGVADLGSGLT